VGGKCTPLPRCECPPDRLRQCGRYEGSSGCGLWLPRTEFHRAKWSPDGFASVCRVCTSKRKGRGGRTKRWRGGEP
jgi:hypothetical protein